MLRRLVLILLVISSASFLAAQVRPQRAHVSEEVMQRLLIYKVDAVCPGHSARLTGDVALKAVIDKSGKVQSLELISGHPMLVPAAIDAAKQWR